MKRRQTTLVLFALFVVLFMGIAMISPPPGSIPVLPPIPYEYRPANFPTYVYSDAPINEVTNEKATLGRVLFYDTRMSKNDELSCGSCHVQSKSFADIGQFSTGINDVETTRNSPNLNDLGWVQSIGLFRDFREMELHDLVLQPILDQNELDGTIELLIDRMSNTNFYPPLFADAFGDEEITEDRIATALTDFINSMTTFNSKFDKWTAGEIPFSTTELAGKAIFEKDCKACHEMITFRSSWATMGFNNGLDEEYEDPGMAGWGGTNLEGIFRAPSLRNIEMTGPYMHDGRFEKLEDVIKFYSEEINPHEDSFFNSNNNSGEPGEPFEGFDYTDAQKEELLAFLHTLTDEVFITDIKFSDPFPTTTVGVHNEIDKLADATVYPNPIVDQAVVTYPAKTATISLYDLHGRLLFTDTSINGEYTLHRKDWSKGMYSLLIQAEGKQSVQKIIFQ